MYDVKKRLNYLKQMYKCKIPMEYAHDGVIKYKTEFDRYNAITEEILKCSDKEMGNLEILLKCELGSAERFWKFKEIVSLFLTIITSIIAVSLLFFEKIIDATSGVEKFKVISVTSEEILIILTVTAILALVGYLIIVLISDRRIRVNTYLLDLLN